MLFLLLIAVFTSRALSCETEDKTVKKQHDSTFIFKFVENQSDDLIKITHINNSTGTPLYTRLYTRLPNGNGKRGNLKLPSTSVLRNRLQTINNTETQIKFKLLNVSKDDAGDYCLDPGNDGIRLIVTDAPKVNIAKQSQTILHPNSTNHLNGELKLSCDAISTTKPKNHNLALVYSWFKDGIFHTTTGNTSILHDNNIDISYKDVNISCIVTDDPGCTEVFKGLTDGSTMSDVQNNKTCVDVLGISKNFTVQPEFGPYNVTIEPSGNITIGVSCQINVTCEGDCIPQCNISWFKNGDKVQDGDKLHMANIQTFDAGRYTCLVKNKHGERNESFYLQVSDAPNINITNQTQPILYPDSTNHLNGKLKLSCDAISTTKPENHNLSLVYLWFKDGIFHTRAGNTSILHDKYIDISYKDVNISCIVTDDPGCTEVFTGLTDGSTMSDVENNSRCNNVLGISKSFTVQPEFGPYNVTIEPSGNITIGVSCQINVTCEGDCIPQCNISWFKNGGKVQDGDKLHMAKIIQKSDAGRYSCLVKNKHGERNESFYLHVSEKPENTEIWTGNKIVGSIFQLISTNTSFECKTNSCNVIYTWSVNDRIIPNSSEASLVLSDYQHDGTLTCLVENSDGQDKVSVQILVGNADNIADPSRDSSDETLITGVTLIIVILVVVIVAVAMVVMYRKYHNKSTYCFKSKYPQRKSFSGRKKKIDKSTVFPDTVNDKLIELNQCCSTPRKQCINRGLHMNVEDLVYADINLPQLNNNIIHGKKESSSIIYEKIDFTKKAPHPSIDIELDSDDDD